MGKNYKISLPGPTPENGKIGPKKGKNHSENTNFVIFSVIFPHFRGSDRGGEFCNFSPFFGDFRPGGFPGSVRGKTTRNSSWNSGAPAAKIHAEIREEFRDSRRTAQPPRRGLKNEDY